MICPPDRSGSSLTFTSRSTLPSGPRILTKRVLGQVFGLCRAFHPVRARATMASAAALNA